MDEHLTTIDAQIAEMDRLYRQAYAIWTMHTENTQSLNRMHLYADMCATLEMAKIAAAVAIP